MNRISRSFLLLATLLLVISAQRSPAPIQEIPESPTPPPAPAIEKSTQPSASESPSSERTRKSRARTTATTAAQPEVKKGPKFQGAWHGTIALGMAGDFNLTLQINSEGNSVIESGGLLGTLTFQATNDGRTVSWHSGLMGEIAWTLTPNSDGATAFVTAKSPLIGSPTATFRRGASTTTSTTTSAKSATGKTDSTPRPNLFTEQAQIPTAKPVPGNPGFVYDPFDPGARQLDVRGKKSGTKVQDPHTGKVFIVP